MTRVGFGTHPRLALALLFLAMVLTLRACRSTEPSPTPEKPPECLPEKGCVPNPPPNP